MKTFLIGIFFATSVTLIVGPPVNKFDKKDEEIKTDPFEFVSIKLVYCYILYYYVRWHENMYFSMLMLKTDMEYVLYLYATTCSVPMLLIYK